MHFPLVYSASFIVSLLVKTAVLLYNVLRVVQCMFTAMFNAVCIWIVAVFRCRSSLRRPVCYCDVFDVFAFDFGV